MAHSNPNLVPTVVTDKNGKTTTVHKKRDAANSAQTSVPAPSLGRTGAKPTTTSRANGVVRVLSEVAGRPAIKTKAERWIKFSDPEQLAVLDDVLESFDTMSARERFVVASALEPLTFRTGHTNAIHEVLALRSAFCSDWAVSNDPGKITGGAEAYVLGLRTDNYRTPLDCSSDQAIQENVALIRFAYELKERSPGGFLPVYQAQTRVGMDEHAYEYDRGDLKELIRSNPQRVGEMIELALINETCDPQRLQALMDHEGHSSLTGGAL